MAKMKNSGIEWIGEIPEDWKTNRIKYLFSIRNERNHLPEDKVQLLSLYTGYGVFPQGEHTTASGNHAQTVEDYKIVKKNDIVVNIILAWMGAIGISDYNGVTSPAYDIYCPDLKKVIPHFYHYVFRTDAIAGECYKYGRGIMMMRWRTYSQEFKQIIIPYPPLEIQKRIADFLDEECVKIDSLKNDIEKQIETLEQYKKSVITEAVTKGINSDVKMKDSGIEWIGEIPEHWETKRAKYIFTPRNDRGNKIELQLLSPTQKYGVIPQALYDEISGMNSVKLKENTDLNLLKTCHKGDYCISLRSFQGGFEYSKYEGVVSPAYQIFYPTIKIADGYYKYLFKEKNFIEKINSFTLSLRDGKPISYFDFSNMYLPLPSAKEQKEIADYLDSKCASIDEIIKTKQKQLETLEEYKKSLIFEYVTGKKKC